MNKTAIGVWEKRVDEAQAALEHFFWNDEIKMYNIETPCPNGSCNTIFHYWWMAHAVDVLVDGLLRTGEQRYAEKLRIFYEGILERNGGSLPNELYDDMEWMALAWLRAYAATGEMTYKQAALVLWEDIKTGWNDHMGGGIAWQKSQLDYKNTPANAPAAILAARLYLAFKDNSDLAWAKKIYEWQKDNLVDPDTGFVWDGMNRIGDGAIDKEWKFTYCQGVYIGAAVELFRASGEQAYLEDAIRSFDAAVSELTDPVTGVLPDEETGDGGLFKGILIRYAAELAKEEGGARAAQLLLVNAEQLWLNGKADGQALFNHNWTENPGEIVTLSVQLSGVMLLEKMAEQHG
ncbi:glycoside hydrolase family 76 protein [Paenibacillus sp. LHD-38]|uniref:glycoside hydrolase family 76 protein n=1 Tax=Paenibacillus sp. LHD-38 TaxID=3072143 RepID=UPI00280EBC11|nr:glycoside hydrolase family 76 protein [Paenibacillus sp. LHD-38]MDQ8734660.1 glycoside hydrolase family 76 protein [Paenibacillus sp. LHD-38]